MSGAEDRSGGGDALATTCAICGHAEEDPRLLARCYGCHRPFHLNPHATAGTDCGDVWTGSSPDDEFTGLEFYCALCFAERHAAAGTVMRRTDAASGDGGALERAIVRRRMAPPPRLVRPPWLRRYRRRDGERR